MNLNWDQLLGFLGGGVAMSVLAHAVDTFPVPNNAYARWVVGIFQFAVGQRSRSTNTFNNANTVTTAVPKKDTP
jgi:hypothetical protein